MKTSLRNFACYLAMVVVQLAYGGSHLLIKISLEKGLNRQVLIVYRHLIAILVLGPLAYAFERKQRPSLSFSTAMKIFVLATLGTSIHLNLFYVGLDYSSATVAGALSNVIPGLTFLLAVLLGMEKVVVKSAKGRAKIFGTLICMSGALVITFWKGAYLFKSWTTSPLINIENAKNSTNSGYRHHKEDWMKGSILILSSNVAWSAWLILQAVVCKAYPAQLTMNTLICLIASLQASVIAVISDRKPSSWRLGWNVQLLAIIYCGVVNSALLYYLQTWCISHKGPVFSAMFSPLVLVIVALFSAIAFAERLHLGSLIGAVFIVIGLYCVLWGKSKDTFIKDESLSTNNSINHQKLEVVGDEDQDVNKYTNK